MGVISPVRLYYPKSAVMFHRYALVTAGGVLSILHQALQDFAYYAVQWPGALDDRFTHQVYLSAGTYRLNILGTTEATSGLIDWYLDGILVLAGQNWYSVGTVYNVVKTTVGVIVYGHGQHVLQGVVTAAGAGGGFRIYLTALALV